MKNAINELKALLDTWGPQKDEDRNKDIAEGIRALEAEQHRADMDANSGLEDLHEETVSLKGSELDRQLHRREEYTFEEAHEMVGHFANEMKVTPLPEDFNPEDNYAPATCFYEDNPTLKCQVERDDDSIDRVPRERKESVDDDLGELDPSAACDLSKEGGCESCQ